MEKTYVAIDLKSFYASVECVERQLDPLNTNLVVADESRTEKTMVFQAGQGFLRSFSVWSRSIRSVCRKLLKDSLQRKAISIRSCPTLPASLIISWQLRKWRNIWL